MPSPRGSRAKPAGALSSQFFLAISSILYYLQLIQDPALPPRLAETGMNHLHRHIAVPVAVALKIIDTLGEEVLVTKSI